MPAQTDTQPPPGILTRTTPADRGAVSRPALAPHLQFRDIGERQTLLVSESFNTLLHGALHRDLLPLLDGRHSQDEIVAALEGAHAAADARAAIAALAAKGYVVSADHGMERSRAAYWSSLGASPRWVERRLAESRVAVEGDDGRLIRHLEENGASVGADKPTLTVVVCDDYLDARLAEVNRRRLAARAPWTLARPRGMEALFGPVFRADGQGPCWDCLASRLRGHREVHSFLRNVAGEEAAFKPFAAQPAVLEAVYGLIAAEIVKWLVLDDAAPLHQHAIAMNVGTFASAQHPVMRRPQCLSLRRRRVASAGSPAGTAQPQGKPQGASQQRRRTDRGAGGHAREVPPPGEPGQRRRDLAVAHDRRERPLAARLLGREQSRHEKPEPHVRSGGAYAARAPARAARGSSRRSAPCARRWSATRAPVTATRSAFGRASAELAGAGEAIHPNDVQLFSDDQLDNAESINAKGHPYNIVPPRFDADAALDWTPVWSLSRQRHLYLPTSMLYSMPAEQRGSADLIADSNGCAAGNTLEEAILQGFYELVERDAFAIWWYNRLRVPAVDLASFDDAYLACAPQQYARYERELWLLDVTSDIGIPAFVALSRRPDARTEDIIYGAGAHADPRLAALRALCELNQCLTWLPRPGKGDGRPMIDDPLALWWWKTARLADCSWLAPAADAPLRKASHYPAIEAADTRDDVETVPRARRGQGHGVPGAGSDPARYRHARGARYRAGHAPLLGAICAGAPLRRARQPRPPRAPPRRGRLESRTRDCMRTHDGH